MAIELFPPLALHEKGRRDGNEDSIYPALLDRTQQASTRLFLVCDGVGGLEKGEEASRLACETFAQSLSWKTSFGGDEIRQAVKETEEAMDRFVENHPEAEGMATTMTLLAFHDSGATVAHIGDSRVYQVRNGQILFRTIDHSMVNDMVAQNILTAEEALVHPKRNIISRALSGTRRPTSADVARIKDIRPGDFFFMCTDGVLESISDDNLANILGKKNASEESLLGEIFTLCRESSRDNFSAYLLRVKNAQLSAAPPSSSPTHQPFEEMALPKKKAHLPVLLLSGVAIAAIFLFLFLKKGNGARSAGADEKARIDSTAMAIRHIDSLNTMTDSLQTLMRMADAESRLAAANFTRDSIKADSILKVQQAIKQKQKASQKLLPKPTDKPIDQPLPAPKLKTDSTGQ